MFGYGSLLREAVEAASPVLCRLGGHRRGWGVAMDNRRAIPGYKAFVDAATGERPAVQVAFLDVRPVPGAAVNGVALAVGDARLRELDRRERNYERRDVTALVEADLGGPVWAYLGRADARRRCADGRAGGTAVVAREYLEGVRSAFGRLGASALAEFDATTEPPGLPVRDLRRVDLPERVEAPS